MAQLSRPPHSANALPQRQHKKHQPHGHLRWNSSSRLRSTLRTLQLALSPEQVASGRRVDHSSPPGWLIPSSVASLAASSMRLLTNSTISLAGSPCTNDANAEQTSRKICVLKVLALCSAAEYIFCPLRTACRLSKLRDFQRTSLDIHQPLTVTDVITPTATVAFPRSDRQRYHGTGKGRRIC